MAKNKKINPDLVDRIKTYESEILGLEERLQLKPVVTLEFPQYRELPSEVLLALKVIENHNRKFMLTYSDMKGQNNGN